MSLHIKILGGTPVSGKSLCHSCREGKVVRGQNKEEKVVCESYGLWYDTRYVVTFPVAECSEYKPKNMPSLSEMEDMAWKVEARKRGPSGFSAPENNLEIVISPPSKKEKE